MSSAAASVMVYRTGHLGDTVCAIPAFRLIRRNFPAARLSLLCDRPAGGKVPAIGVAKRLGLFDQILTYDSGRGFLGLLQLVHHIRRERPDMVVILSQERESLKRLSRKKKFIRLCGVRDVRGSSVLLSNASWQFSEPVRLIRLLNDEGIAGNKPDYDIPLDEMAKKRVAEKLAAAQLSTEKPFLVFCGGGKAATQRWDLRRYARVLKTVSVECSLPVVGIGDDRELAQYQSQISPGFPPLRLMQGLDLPELFELLRMATSYIGNDTGPMHVAAAVGCPVAVVMSGRNHPGAWDPDVEPRLIFRHRTECEGCFLSECSRERHRCMTEISESQVLEGLASFLRALPRGTLQPMVTER